MKLDAQLFEDLEWRGIVKLLTDDSLAKTLATEPITVYAGFDPTSDSLHIGSLVPVLTLRRFQMAGHRVIAVVGGATGMIGDPSGKSAERSLLTADILARNQVGITQVISRFLDLGGPNPASVKNNADWFKMSFVDFLRDVGKHFTVNHMMAKDSVRSRLEDRDHGISYTEFSYMLLQAYDFHVLHDEENCRLQIGATDQWGNITAGTDLIRRMAAAAGKPLDHEVYGLCHPLVSKADGTKFGKTEQGTIWLDAGRTSPYAFYQFLIQTSDADVIQYLKYFTFLSRPEVEALEASVQATPEKREAQRALASELVRLVHGEAELARAEKASSALFSTEIRDLDRPTLLAVMGGAPQATKPKSILSPGWSVIDALVESTLCASKGAARKDLVGGGVYVNNARITDVAAVLTERDLIAGGFVVLRKGKKTYHLWVFN